MEARSSIRPRRLADREEHRRPVASSTVPRISANQSDIDELKEPKQLARTPRPRSPTVRAEHRHRPRQSRSRRMTRVSDIRTNAYRRRLSSYWRFLRRRSRGRCRPAATEHVHALGDMHAIRPIGARNHRRPPSRTASTKSHHASSMEYALPAAPDRTRTPSKEVPAGSSAAAIVQGGIREQAGIRTMIDPLAPWSSSRCGPRDLGVNVLLHGVERARPEPAGRPQHGRRPRSRARAGGGTRAPWRARRRASGAGRSECGPASMIAPPPEPSRRPFQSVGSLQAAHLAAGDQRAHEPGLADRACAHEPRDRLVGRHERACSRPLRARGPRPRPARSARGTRPTSATAASRRARACRPRAPRGRPGSARGAAARDRPRRRGRRRGRSSSSVYARAPSSCATDCARPASVSQTATTSIRSAAPAYPARCGALIWPSPTSPTPCRSLIQGSRRSRAEAARCARGRRHRSGKSPRRRSAHRSFS